MTTGQFDRNGIEIHTGDLVRFWCHGDWDTMIASYGPGPKDGWTMCIDHVEQCEDGKFYSIDDETAGGAHIERVAPHCMIVGKYKKPASMPAWWETANAKR
jgi:hypothetical protein